MRAEAITITPKLAESILATSNGNRPLKTAKVASYARDMKAGNWCLNGESIIVDSSGSLVDGHHRLRACILSGLPFQSMVVWGAPPDAQKTVDMGASRSASDALHFYGYRNVNMLHAIVRVLLSMEAGRPRSANPSTQEVFAFIEANPEIVDSAAFASNHSKGMPKVHSVLGAIYFLEAKDGRAERVVQFYEVLGSGVPAYPGCAAHALRERLIKDQLSAKSLSVADRQLLILAAWEKFRASVPVKVLKCKATFNIVGFTRKEHAA
jgi:hypothetical protein